MLHMLMSEMTAPLLSTHACHGLSAPQPDTSASFEHLYGSCRVRNVEMALLSQDLADLEATDVAMPGMHQQLQSAGSSPAEGLEAPQTLVAGALVTVTGFGRQVHIMSTKTRPKKLSLLGSDGKSYNFLLKVRAPKPGDFCIMQSALAVLSLAASRRGLQLWLLLPSRSPRGLLRPPRPLLPSCSRPLSSKGGCCCCPHAHCSRKVPCSTKLSAAALALAGLLTALGALRPGKAAALLQPQTFFGQDP